MKKLLKFSSAVLLLFICTACASMQSVNIDTAMKSGRANGVDYGNLVEVRTLDNQTVKFRVTDITNQGLGGNLGFYAFEDMTSLKVDRSADRNEASKTLIFGLLALGAAIALIANADSVSVCSPSPCPEP